MESKFSIVLFWRITILGFWKDLILPNIRIGGFLKFFYLIWQVFRRVTTIGNVNIINFQMSYYYWHTIVLLELSGEHGRGGIRWQLNFPWIPPCTKLVELK